MDLLQHLNIEYNLHSDLMSVFESHGVLDGADVFSLKIRDLIVDSIKGGVLQDKIVVKSDIKWFDNVVIYANVRVDDGGVFERESEYDYNSEIGTPKISLNIIGSFLYIRNSIAPMVCHELLHAYEDGLRRNGERGSLSDDVGGVYKLAKIIIDNYKLFRANTVTFAKCIYWLSDAEQRANIGTLELELKQYKNNLSNPIEAKEVIESTQVYRTFLEIKKDVGLISEWTDDEIVGVGEDIKKHIYNFLADYNFLKRCVKRLAESAKRFEDRFVVVSSKLAYDIATENKYRF